MSLIISPRTLLEFDDSENLNDIFPDEPEVSPGLFEGDIAGLSPEVRIIY